DATVGLNKLGRRVIVHFSPQKANERVERVFFDLAAFAPKSFDDRGARHDATAVANQKFEQPKFRERQLDFSAVSKGAERIRFQHQIAKFQNIFRFWRASSADGADSCEKLLERKWFRQVVVSAGVQSFNDVGKRVARRQHQNADISLATAKLLGNFEPAHARKHHVEQNHIERTALRKSERACPVTGKVN